MKIGILGSGFGIYGYLPAACKNFYSPIVLEKNRNKIDLRPELIQYKKRITYAECEKSLIEKSDALIIATTPKYQFELVQSFDLKNINHLYLEKPIAPSLESYSDLIKFLTSNKKSFSVAYLFIYTSWYTEVTNLLKYSHGNNLKFMWSVKKIQSTWKNSVESGGGLLHFYGIHFLALLYHLGISNINIEIIENNEKVEINAIDESNNKIHILINYAENSYFEIKLIDILGDNVILEDQTPFGLQNKLGIEDTRVDLIARYLKDFKTTSRSTGLGIEEYIYRVLKSCRENPN
jgi:predicted dehydrogenase